MPDEVTTRIEALDRRISDIESLYGNLRVVNFESQVRAAWAPIEEQIQSSGRHPLEFNGSTYPDTSSGFERFRIDWIYGIVAVAETSPLYNIRLQIASLVVMSVPNPYMSLINVGNPDINMGSGEWVQVGTTRFAAAYESAIRSLWGRAIPQEYARDWVGFESFRQDWVTLQLQDYPTTSPGYAAREPIIRRVVDETPNPYPRMDNPQRDIPTATTLVDLVQAGSSADVRVIAFIGRVRAAWGESAAFIASNGSHPLRPIFGIYGESEEEYNRFVEDWISTFISEDVTEDEPDDTYKTILANGVVSETLNPFRTRRLHASVAGGSIAPTGGTVTNQIADDTVGYDIALQEFFIRLPNVTHSQMLEFQNEVSHVVPTRAGDAVVAYMRRTVGGFFGTVKRDPSPVEKIEPKVSIWDHLMEGDR
jgi:hypothetical protein